LVSSVCLNPDEFYLKFHPDFFNEVCVVFRFLSDSSVIRLSVYTKIVLSLVSKYCIFSSAFSIASCSAWLFEHRSSNLYFFLSPVAQRIPDTDGLGQPMGPILRVLPLGWDDMVSRNVVKK
jgi:hypothetical protein